MSEKSDRPVNIRYYRGLARKIVQHYFRTPAARLVYRPSGLTNYVFAINHTEGQFVIRISPEPERIAAFRKEWWAAQHVRKVGVPSPDVIAVGNDLGPEPYMIMRRVNGAEATHHPKRSRIIHEMGRLASVINSIKTNGFGSNFDWNPEGSKIATWSQYLDKEYQLEKRLEFFATHQIIPASALNKISQFIKGMNAAEITPSLNHGDLRLKNVIVDEDAEITAIIDWEECVSTVAPQWELSIALHDLSIDEKQVFLGGYGLRSEQLERLSPVIKAFNLLNYHGAASAAIEQNDEQKLSEIRLRLNGTLDLFSLAC